MYYWEGSITDAGDSKFGLETTSSNFKSVTNEFGGYSPEFVLDVSEMVKPTVKVVYEGSLNASASFSICKAVGNTDDAVSNWSLGDGDGWSNDTLDLTEIVSGLSEDFDKTNLVIEYKSILTKLFVYDADDSDAVEKVAALSATE